MNNEWITDRLPTRFDGDEFGLVWVTDSDGRVLHRLWESVTADMPWKHLTRPQPYVKPKRYVVRPAQDICPNATVSGYVVWADVGGVHADNIPTIEAAERIAAIYEEVMP